MGARRKKVETADRKVARATKPARDNAVVHAAGEVSEMADQPPLIALCATTLAAGLVLRNPRLARAGARMLAAELLATALKSVVKHRVDRSRPHHVDDGGSYTFRRGGSHASALSSFPSGHTAGAVAVAGAVTREYPNAAAPAYATAAGVAAIQVPRGAHYMSDVAAGALVGAISEIGVDIAARLLATGWHTYKSGRARRYL